MKADFYKVKKKKNKHETIKNYVSLLWNFKKTLSNPFLSRNEIRELQNLKLQKLVRHAYNNVPYYQNSFKRAGVLPEDIKTVDDLCKLPIISKAIVKELPPNQITSRHSNIDNCHARKTSGSTGTPMIIYWDNPAITTHYSTCARSHHILNCSIRDKILSIGPTYYPTGMMIQKFGICRVEKISPFSNFAVQIDKINDFEPDILLCYPSVLKSLNHYIRNNGCNIYKPRMVITSGEFLDKKTSIDTEKILGTRPFEFYGAWEMGRIANDCRYGKGLHINEDIFIPEFIHAGPEYGEDAYSLVLTNLHNYTMPFIRYQVGDIVKPIYEPCDCRSSFTRIKILDGRGSYVVQLPNGNKISALYLNGIISNLPGVRQFKIIQESLKRLNILVVNTGELPEDAAKKAIEEIDAVLPGIKTEIKKVNYIEPGTSGKFKQFESLLN